MNGGVRWFFPNATIFAKPLVFHKTGSQSSRRFLPIKNRPTSHRLRGRAFSIKRDSFGRFGSYSVLSATTGSLRAAEEAGIRPEMSVSAMLSRTSRAA